MPAVSLDRHDPRSLPAHYANGRATMLRRSLFALWRPGEPGVGRRPASALRPAIRTDVDVPRAAGVAGPAFRDPLTTSLGFPYLPVAGREQPFTIWLRVAVRSIEYTEFLRQYQTSQADRLILSTNASGRVDYNHPTQLAGSFYVTAGRVHTIAVTEHPPGPARIFVDGRQSAAGLTSTGRASRVNTALASSGSIDIFSLAIFRGLALLGVDLRALHADPDLLTRPHPFYATSTIETIVSERRRPHELNTDMPNRPWWRRYRFRFR